MQRMSQKKLLEEGFSSILRGIARGAGNVARGMADEAMSKGAPAIKKMISQAGDDTPLKDRLKRGAKKDGLWGLTQKEIAQLSPEEFDQLKKDPAEYAAETGPMIKGGLKKASDLRDKMDNFFDKTLANQFKEGDNVSWKTKRGHVRLGEVIGFTDKGLVNLVYTDDHGNTRENAINPANLTKVMNTNSSAPEEDEEKSQKSLLKHLQSLAR